MRTCLLLLPLSTPAFCAWAPRNHRSLELPAILVVNSHSLSDAEDFTEGCSRRPGVTRPIGESNRGKDSQLDAAPKELPAQIGSK